MSEQIDWKERLQTYFSHISEVVGWGDFTKILPFLEIIQTLQLSEQIRGGVGEIGIHQGRFFLLLDQLRNAGEQAVAIDVFDAQALNIDGSGRGNLQQFSENLENYSSDSGSVTTLSADSLALSPEKLLQSNGAEKFRLFSIDGGHTVQHVISDLSLVSQVITNGGVIFLDDYYHRSWPGVHEGFIRYMLFHNKRLAPFAFHANRLMITTLSYHEMFLAAIRKFFAETEHRLKVVPMSGFDVVTVWPKK